MSRAGAFVTGDWRGRFGMGSSASLFVSTARFGLLWRRCVVAMPSALPLRGVFLTTRVEERLCDGLTLAVTGGLGAKKVEMDCCLLFCDNDG